VEADERVLQLGLSKIPGEAVRILLSAYACEPGKGSEPGVGWHWATELASLGHEVVVVTRSNNRDSIEKALENAPLPGLHFRYYDLPPWGRWWKRGPRGVELYYWLWQIGAYRQAKLIIRERQIDLVHHLTFGMFRQPSFMGYLGLPFVVGPIGGGETTPKLLREGFPARIAFGEMLRELSIKLSRSNPLVLTMFRQATVIFCKTRETLSIIPVTSREKCCVHFEIGIDPVRMMPEVTAKAADAEFLYAGRLVYWKGLHLALKALAALRKDRPDARLTVIGTGPDESRLKKLSVNLGLGDSVRWLGWISQEEMWTHYRRYTALVSPSLHDSSGNVLLEAMSQSLPVICLDTGGPGAIIPNSCGMKIQVKDRREAEVVSDLSASMKALADDPEFRLQMACRALEVAKGSTWRDVVSSAYAHIDGVLVGSRGSVADRRL
jgi:glycosyltransferase involved in cell wall biosynthesis